MLRPRLEPLRGIQSPRQTVIVAVALGFVAGVLITLLAVWIFG
jgi:hypothetical protein